mmetsp:Transcript_6606/g.8174  ORF Transcript_6606/g.8174 Transcript_6606/m.8174 type:complete len:88 (-) Transcript_6606:1872-2135(-)
MFLPDCNTTIRSARAIVDSRCAMTITVRPSKAVSRASRTKASLSPSRAEVGSSKTRIAGSRMIARAMATRCFWPPLREAPPSPTGVA